ncbi:TnsD family Tn7-like transposition protein [Bacillus paranthracis]
MKFDYSFESSTSKKNCIKRLKVSFLKAFLEKYESTLNIADEYNWLKVITRNTKRHVHPFRHLLMLRFFRGNYR